MFEPWGYEVGCPRSVYEGDVADEVRVWGRRRLHTLERLVPVARSFTVHLLGKGMPSFYVADLGDLSYTLGLSGWTRNDWSGAGNFDLLAPRAEVDDVTKRRVFAALSESWSATADELARRLDLDRAAVLGALAAYTQAGRAVYDLEKRCYRLRELSREPLPMDRLRFENEREAHATRFLDRGAVDWSSAEDDGRGVTLLGLVRHGETPKEPWLRIDRDERVVDARCTCNFYHAEPAPQRALRAHPGAAAPARPAAPGVGGAGGGVVTGPGGTCRQTRDTNMGGSDRRVRRGSLATGAADRRPCHLTRHASPVRSFTVPAPPGRPTAVRHRAADRRWPVPTLSRAARS